MDDGSHERKMMKIKRKREHQKLKELSRDNKGIEVRETKRREERGERKEEG